MNNQLTELVFIIDKSASMASIRDEAQDGINKFIEDQKKLDGQARLTIVEFNSEHNVYCDRVNIKEFDKYELKPSGFTAFYDSIGWTINHVGEQLSNEKEEDRPGLVLVTVMTDGEDNRSYEFNAEKIKQMVEHQESTYSWKFMFLCANLSDLKSVNDLSLRSGQNYKFDPRSINDTYGKMSSQASLSRQKLHSGVHASDIGDYTLND